VIEIQELYKYYGDQRAVGPLTTNIERGEIIGLLGLNGAGKTTTLRILACDLLPTSGSVKVAGVDVVERPDDVKSKVGYLPDRPPLYEEQTVSDYLTFAARLRGVPSHKTQKLVAEAVELTELGDVSKKIIGALSHGYKQRVGIAQAIVHDPDVVILDEPTVGLDPNQIREIRNLIRELGGKHSVILSTHFLPEVEAVCDHVQILHHGHLVYSDTIERLEKFQGSRTLLVGLRRPPALGELSVIAGITTIQSVSDTVFRFQFAASEDPTDELVKRAAARDWGLYQLSPAQTRLEDVFAHLTQHDAPA
jgi:ABC-2 type transport system ATP-binding protein